jgi:hypothetical protein
MKRNTMRTKSPKFLPAMLGAMLSVVVPLPAAVTIYVTSTDDSGPGSLRQAIMNVNAADGGTILFSNVTGTIFLSNDLPAITANTMILGPGTNLLSINGGGRVRIFTMTAGSSNTLVGLSIAFGSVTNSNGGGISNAGGLRLVNCAVVSCSTEGGVGGGIYTSGTLSMDGSVLYGNSSRGINRIATNYATFQPGGPALGGGIYAARASVLISNSALCTNYAQGGFGASNLGLTSGLPGGAASGGGICVSNGVLQLLRCSLNLNHARGGNGGLGYPGAGSGGSGGEAFGGCLAAYSSSVCIIASQLSGNDGTAGNGKGYKAGGKGGDATGGAIYNDATDLCVTNSTFSGNSAVGGAGGEGYTYGGPGAAGGAQGGGIAMRIGSITLVGCTLSGNVVRGGAGGRYSNGGFPPVDTAACGGSAEGGGIRGDTTNIFLVNTTVADNTSVGGAGGGGTSPPCNGSSQGGGLHVATNSFRVLNILTARNSATEGPDVFGAVNSQGYNLVGQTNGTIGWLASDLQNVEPRLGPLQDNGGPVFTHALLAGSPAIDAGANSGLAFDARGQFRTIDDPAVTNAFGGDGTDIGAFEVNHILIGTETRRVGNDIVVRFTTVSDKTYGVEFRTQVGDDSWTELPGTVAGTGGIVTYTDVNAATLPRRFYRIFERAP